VGADPGLSDRPGAARPASARILSALLVVEIATAGMLVALGALVAISGLWVRRDGWSDLAVALGVAVTLAAAVVLLALVVAWVALTRRRGPLVVASVVGHMLPTAALLTAGTATGTGQSLVVLGTALLGAAGIALTLAPATRDWVRPRAQ
jgi:hypothetical protein